jgi:probable HAF family extracellular repeat protein
VSAEAHASNHTGIVVGVGARADGTTRAWAYRNGSLRDLNALLPPNSGWILNAAEDINDAGQIVGMGTLNGVQRGFVMDLGAGDLIVSSPVALDQTVQTHQNAPVDITLGLQSPSGSSIQWAVTGAPAHGTVKLAGATATYIPAAGFAGTDSFLVQADNGTLRSNTPQPSPSWSNRRRRRRSRPSSCSVRRHPWARA